MENDKLVPKRRFKEFQNAEAWEQRKLGEIVKSHNAGIYVSKEKYGQGINIVGVGDIYGSDSIDGQSFRFAPVQDEKFILDENDLIYGESSLVPEGIARTMYVTKNGAGTAFAWHTRRVKIDNELCSSHIATLELNYNKSVRNYLMRASTQTALTGMTTEGFFGATITYPSMEEQDKISAFFVRMDNLITLHQRKLEKLKNLKSAYLSEMFPAEGEDKPRRRFAGFTEAWEQRKCKEVATFAKGNGYSKGDLKEDGTPIIQYGRLYTKYEFSIEEVDTFADEKDGAIFSEGNEVIIPASGETAEDIARASAVIKSRIILGGDLNIVRPFEHIRNEFLALTISNGNAQKELAKRAQGKSVVHVHNSDIQEVIIVYPTEQEQREIIACFKQLDNLITLHQRKLEKLKNIKKAYLTEMFV